MKKNFHSHTLYCNHSDLSVEESIRLHKEAGYTVLGISEHAPIPGYTDSFRLQEEQVDEYIEEVREAAGRVEGIEVLCGVEAEYILGDREHLEYLRELRKKADYLVMANHIVGDLRRGEFVHFSRNDPKPEHLKMNTELIREGWSTGLFAFIAHPDSILKRYRWDEHAEEMAHEIGRFAQESGAILEINANGIRYGSNRSEDEGTHAYTNLNFWKIVGEYRVNVIVSGDTHFVRDIVDTCVEEATELAKAMGFNIVEDFRDI